MDIRTYKHMFKKTIYNSQNPISKLSIHPQKREQINWAYSHSREQCTADSVREPPRQAMQMNWTATTSRKPKSQKTVYGSVAFLQTRRTTKIKSRWHRYMLFMYMFYIFMLPVLGLHISGENGRGERWEGKGEERKKERRKEWIQMVTLGRGRKVCEDHPLVRCSHYQSPSFWLRGWIYGLWQCLCPMW